MSNLREAAQQALWALEAVDNDEHGTSFPATVSSAITDLRAALEQDEPEGSVCIRCGALAFDPLVPQQAEPVAWMCPDDPEPETAFSWEAGHCDDCGKQRIPLYAALVQDQDPELSAALGWPGGISDPVLDRETLLQQVARLVERAHGIEEEE